MPDDRKRLDAVEDALLELDAAEKASVFQRTELDAGWLLTAGVQPQRSGSRWVALRILAAAASVAIAVGLLSSTFTSERDEMRPLGRVAKAPVEAYDGGEGGFYGCFGGPNEGVLTDCRAHDYDADGDVDLADFSAFQLALADTSRVGEFEAR